MHHASVRSAGGTGVDRKRGERGACCSMHPPSLTEYLVSPYQAEQTHSAADSQTVACSKMSTHTSHIMPGFSQLARHLEEIVEEASREVVGAPPIPGRVGSLWQVSPSRR